MFPWLGDVIPVPIPVLRNVVSIGDLFMVAGAMLAVQLVGLPGRLAEPETGNPASFSKRTAHRDQHPGDVKSAGLPDSTRQRVAWVRGSWRVRVPRLPLQAVQLQELQLQELQLQGRRVHVERTSGDSCRGTGVSTSHSLRAPQPADRQAIAGTAVGDRCRVVTARRADRNCCSPGAVRARAWSRSRSRWTVSGRLSPHAERWSQQRSSRSWAIASISACRPSKRVLDSGGNLFVLACSLPDGERQLPALREALLVVLGPGLPIRSRTGRGDQPRDRIARESDDLPEAPPAQRSPRSARRARCSARGWWCSTRQVGNAWHVAST